MRAKSKELLLLLFSLCFLATASAQEVDKVSPYAFSLEGGLQSLLSKSSDYRAEGVGISYALKARIPLYQNWGVEVSGHLLESKNKGVGESLRGYAILGGVSYMYPWLKHHLWLDGSLSIGWLSELLLSLKDKVKNGENTIPHIASSMPAKLSLGATWNAFSNLGIRSGITYWCAPTARPYNRSSKSGLNGWEITLGLSYMINY